MAASRRTSTKPSIHPEPLFIDTWGWLVLADAADPAHDRVVSERRARENLVTSDYILDETFTRLFSRAGFSAGRKFCDGIFEAAAERRLRIERITPDRFDAAYLLRLRYRDKPAISFTDLTSFVVMRELGINEVLTGDAHFTHVQLGFRRIPSFQFGSRS